jgi:hypothetical protein
MRFHLRLRFADKSAMSKRLEHFQRRMSSRPKIHNAPVSEGDTFSGIH